MGDIRHNTAAVCEYLRALRSSARDAAVAEAEAEICRAWAEELDRVQQSARLAIDSAEVACEMAQKLVRAHQETGDLDSLIDAQRRLERAGAQRRRSLEAADVLLDAVTDELELLSLAAEERETVALANRIWVDGAARAACAAGISGIIGRPADFDPFEAEFYADTDGDTDADADDGLGTA